MSDDLSASARVALRRRLSESRGTEQWVGPFRAVLKGERDLGWLSEQVDDDFLPPVVVRQLTPPLAETWSPAARLAALEARRRKRGMSGLFSTAETATHGKPELLRQSATDLDGVYKAAQRVAPHHRRVLAAVGEELGGGMVAHDDVPSHGPTRKITFLGPMKTRERAESKIRTDYGGDAGRITDIVRGSVSVPHVDDVPHAVEVLRKHADAQGFDIVKPKNRFHHEKGSRTHTGARPGGGYRDANVLLRHRDTGALSEVQVHAHPFLHAKDQEGGHAAYVEHTELIRKHGTAPPDRIVKRLGDLESHQKRVYSAAWRKARAPR